MHKTSIALFFCLLFLEYLFLWFLLFCFESSFAWDFHSNYDILNLIILQMICSCGFLYALRHLKLISFSAGESLTVTDNSKTFVPLNTLIHTIPLAAAYLLYMVLVLLEWNFPFCREKFSLSHINMWLFWFSLKASYDGVCSRSECPHVYNPEKNNSRIYNDCWVYPCAAEVYPSNYWKVILLTFWCNYRNVKIQCDNAFKQE